MMHGHKSPPKNTKVCVISSITQRKKIYFCPTLFFSFRTYVNQLTVQVLDLLWCPESISIFFYTDLRSYYKHQGDLIFLFSDSTFFHLTEWKQFFPLSVPHVENKSIYTMGRKIASKTQNVLWKHNSDILKPTDVQDKWKTPKNISKEKLHPYLHPQYLFSLFFIRLYFSHFLPNSGHSSVKRVHPYLILQMAQSKTQ